MLRAHIRRKTLVAPDGGQRILFDDLRIEVPRGEVCAIMGPSGVGKSSLISILAGIDCAFDGDVDGRPEPLGMLFQSPRLLPWRTVRENLQVVHGAAAHEIPARLRDLDLHEAGDVYPQRLSAGMAKRAALARALIVHPRLLVLDEPCDALDALLADKVRRVLKAACARPETTTLLVTHQAADVAALATRVIVLEGAPARIVRDISLLNGVAQTEAAPAERSVSARKLL